MLNNRIIAVIKRELRERVLKKSFILTTLAVPIIFVLIIGMQVLITTFEGESDVKLTVISESEQVTQKLEEKFSEKDYVKDKTYTFNFLTFDSTAAKSYIENQKQDILDGKLTGIVYIPAKAIQTKDVLFYSKNTKNLAVERKLKYVINSVLLDTYFAGKSISQDDINYINNDVDFDTFKITKEEEVVKDMGGNLALAYILSFMLYFSLLLMGSLSLQSVIEEKSSKIVEVLLSSVNSQEFMTGKILGAAITGLIQMSVWLIPILIISQTSLPFIPKELIITIDPFLIVYFLINFFLGLVIYLALFTTAGSLVDTPQDAQSLMTPIMMLIIFPFFITFTMIQNPTNTLAYACSFVPFASVMVMPVRMSVVDVPLWQVAIAFLVNIATLWGIIKFAGKLFRIGILRTGKKPSLKDIYKWVRYSD